MFSKLVADPDQTVKNGSELLDRLLKGKKKQIVLIFIFKNDEIQVFRIIFQPTQIVRNVIIMEGHLKLCLQSL